MIGNKYRSLRLRQSLYIINLKIYIQMLNDCRTERYTTAWPGVTEQFIELLLTYQLLQESNGPTGHFMRAQTCPENLPNVDAYRAGL